MNPADAVVCRACGAPAAGARFCGHCGHPTGDPPTMVALDPLGTAPRPTEQRATVTSRPPDRRRTTVLVAGLAAVALLGLGVSQVLDGGPGSTAAPPVPAAGATATTAPATTAPTAAAPTTDPPPPATAPTTTAVAFLAGGPTLVLDEAQRGRGLFLADGRRVVRVDLGTGAVTSRAIDFTFNPQLTGIVDGRLVFGGPSLVTLAADLTGEPRFIPDDGFQFVGAPGVVAEGVWMVRPASAAGEGGAVRLVGPDGTIRREVPLPGRAFAVGFLSDRILVAQFGQLATVDLAGRAQFYADGIAAAVRGDTVLWIGCDRAGQCTHHVGTATVPDTGRSALTTSYLLTAGRADGADLPRSSTLAPDGTTVVAAVGSPAGDARRRLVDLATGATHPTAGPGQASGWTPEGDWFLETTSADTLVATNVRDGRTVTIGAPRLVNLATAFAALVVG